MKIRVKEVKALDNLNIEVLFSNGFTKIYNMESVIEEFSETFSILKTDTNFFKTVKNRKDSIYWDDKIDLAAEEIWENGLLVSSDISLKGKITHTEGIDNDFQEVNLKFKIPKSKLYEFDLLEGDHEVIFDGEKFSF